MKTLNIKADGSIDCVWSVYSVKTDTSNSDIPSETLAEINTLMSQIQADGFQEIHFEYGLGKNFTHKAGLQKMEEITNTDNNLFATMETWAANLLSDENDLPVES